MCRLCDMVNYYEETDYVQSYSKSEFKDFWSADDCNLKGGVKLKAKKVAPKENESAGSSSSNNNHNHWERGHEIWEAAPTNPYKKNIFNLVNTNSIKSDLAMLLWNEWACTAGADPPRWAEVTSDRPKQTNQTIDGRHSYFFHEKLTKIDIMTALFFAEPQLIVI